MAQKLTLIIGNKNYSSWSLRPWLVLKHFDIPFKEVLVPLYTGEYKKKLLKHSKAGRVPSLNHGKIKVWESIAICEYIAGLYPKKNMWPKNAADRAWARSVACEMHSGFFHLRHNMPCNIRGRWPGNGMNPKVQADVDRIIEIWSECRRAFKSKGPFLFGSFSIADAMYAPVVTRFRTYGVKLPKICQDYANAVLNHPAFKEWEEAGINEAWVIPQSEIYNPKYKK